MIGAGVGGNVAGPTLNCGKRYRRKGTRSNNRMRGMIHTQILDLKLVATGTISKSPAPWPTYLYDVSWA